MASKTLRFIFHHPLKQWPTGKKKAEVEKKNFENGKLHSYLRAIKREITGISFKDMDQVTLILCETLTEKTTDLK